MPFTEKRLCNPTTLTTSGQTIYTVPDSKTCIVKQIVVTNFTASAATFSMYIGSAATPNALFNATSVAANDTLIINLSQVLSQNEILTALASANSSLNITISGVENDGPLTPTATYIADQGVTTAKLADNSVTSAKIAAGAVVTADIADNAVTLAKIDSTLPLSGFRNAIINGGFDIWQRGAGPTTFTAYGYLADRWRTYGYAANSTTISRQPFTLGSPATGAPEAQYFLRANATSTQMLLEQPVENVRTFAGETVTMSFWARVGSGTATIGIYAYQYFGTTGSGGSTAVQTYGTSTFTATTSWQRFQTTITLPSISGKTIGTSGDDAVWFSMYSSTLNVNFDFWGVQVERGAIATPFERRPYGVELTLCQRYYEKSYTYSEAPGTNTTTGMVFICGTSNSGGDQVIVIKYAVPKRAATPPTFYRYTGTSGSWHYQRSGVGETAMTMSQAYTGTNQVVAYGNVGANWVACEIYGHWVTDSEL